MRHVWFTRATRDETGRDETARVAVAGQFVLWQICVPIYHPTIDRRNSGHELPAPGGFREFVHAQSHESSCKFLFAFHTSLVHHRQSSSSFDSESVDAITRRSRKSKYRRRGRGSIYRDSRSTEARTRHACRASTGAELVKRCRDSSCKIIWHRRLIAAGRKTIGQNLRRVGKKKKYARIMMITFS